MLLSSIEIRDAVEAIEAEFSQKDEAVDENITQLEGEIKAAVIEYGVTVSGDHLQAVFNKGRTSFETERVKAYLKSEGLLDKYTKKGKPYCSLKKK